jgi:hypothetical protein
MYPAADGLPLRFHDKVRPVASARLHKNDEIKILARKALAPALLLIRPIAAVF